MAAGHTSTRPLVQHQQKRRAGGRWLGGREEGGFCVLVILRSIPEFGPAGSDDHLGVRNLTLPCPGVQGALLGPSWATDPWGGLRKRRASPAPAPREEAWEAPRGRACSGRSVRACRAPLQGGLGWAFLGCCLELCGLLYSPTLRLFSHGPASHQTSL